MNPSGQVYAKIRGTADAAVFFDEVSQRWLTGFHSTDGAVIVTAEGAKLIIDSRYYEAAERSLKNGELQEGTQVVLLENGVINALKTHLNAGTAAFDSALVTVDRLENLKKEFPDVEFTPISGICTEFREIKTKNELKYIKTAQEITDAAFTHILKFIRKGVTERQIAAQLEFFMKSNGADCPAFETIAVSGKNSSLPHGVPSDCEITENSFLTMDFGAKYRGYCSDMTRTVVFGRADEEMREIYGIVLEAQKAAINLAKDGVNCADVDKAARDIITEKGYGAKFGHSTGHSLGLEIHEFPAFSPKNTKILKCGMVLSVEPGIYIENKYGVRIEDIGAATMQGFEIFTKSEKELIEV